MTKPSINWDHVSAEFRWLVHDESGEGYLHTGSPCFSEDPGYGCWSGGDVVNADVFASYTPGTCDWKDSLIKRPEAPND
jgi:hypothetical protein